MIRYQDRNRPPPMMTTRRGDEQTPGWALGLRDLYCAIADESIPADFQDLLAKLERKAVRGSSH